MFQLSCQNEILKQKGGKKTLHIKHGCISQTFLSRKYYVHMQLNINEAHSKSFINGMAMWREMSICLLVSLSLLPPRLISLDKYWMDCYSSL